MKRKIFLRRGSGGALRRFPVGPKDNTVVWVRITGIPAQILQQHLPIQDVNQGLRHTSLQPYRYTIQLGCVVFCLCYVLTMKARLSVLQHISKGLYMQPPIHRLQRRTDCIANTTN
jgi:hypothetical protein